MNRLVIALANEQKYFKIFMAVLAVYGFLVCVAFGLANAYCPNSCGTLIVLAFLGTVSLAVAGRLTHVYCYNKLYGIKDDDQDSV